MPSAKEHKLSHKIWLEFKGKPILGKGGVQILEQVNKDQSISKAALNLRMSYRYVWNYLDQMTKALGQGVVITHKGGRSGGGGACLSPLGESLVKEYREIDRRLNQILAEVGGTKPAAIEGSSEHSIEGKVRKLEKSHDVCEIVVEIETPTVLRVAVPRKKLEDTKIERGSKVELALKKVEIKSS